MAEGNALVRSLINEKTNKIYSTMKKYRDHYFNRAKAEAYPARSVYKLKELDKRFHLFCPGQVVLDLGAAPGSWTLYAAERTGEEGRVLAVDLQNTVEQFPANTLFMQEDVFFRSPKLNALLEEMGPFHLVLSDMAPKTTGHKFTDQARSCSLCEEALAVACAVLIKGGHFVTKIFQGPDDQQFLQTMRPLFQKVKTFKPKSSRRESKEMFYVGMGFIGSLEKGE